MTFFLIASAIKVFVVFNLIMVGVALLTLLERRVCAWMQDRLGPNRVGPQGILQPAADGLKNFLKEETSPALADKTLFTLAPIVSFVPALLTFGVIPFAAPLPTRWGLVPMVVADLPIGFLYILAISSLGVYGIVLAGWSSNNKKALLGRPRAAALMATLFFGGWEIPFTSWDSTGDPTVLKSLVTLAFFGLKTFAFLFTYIWIRWTLPRFRYDQLMALGWKVLLPLALLYVTIIAVAIWFTRVQLGWDYGARMAWVLGGLNVLLLVGLLWVLDRGRIVSGIAEETA